TLAYDGTAYQGYQRQPDGVPTVQAVVERALADICGEHVTVYAAGRTDTGVHATGQVIACDADWRHGAEALYRAVNSKLPPDVAITSLAETAADFNPRFNALRREYQYTMLLAKHALPLQRHTAWVLREDRVPDFRLSNMLDAATMLPGTRDFGALGRPPQGDNTVRTVFRSEWSTVWLPEGMRLTYTIEADAFLYRMVRRTVGMLYDVGRGRMSLSQFESTLHSGEIATGVTIAPPQGLVLTRVTYPEEPAQT
ncbi:MAG: tRNA pseudouridine(38-40) synthase TruA, partial [Chloroflexota bacterium]